MFGAESGSRTGQRHQGWRGGEGWGQPQILLTNLGRLCEGWDVINVLRKGKETPRKISKTMDLRWARAVGQGRELLN